MKTTILYILLQKMVKNIQNHIILKKLNSKKMSSDNALHLKKDNKTSIFYVKKFIFQAY